MIGPGHVTGRWSDLAPDRRETKALHSGADFRLPEYRREVFKRFYRFHLRYRTHPGCVYMTIPYLFEGSSDVEQKLWFCFVNGLTQNPVTSLVILNNIPEVPRSEAAMAGLTFWFNENWDRLPFDTDRRYQKKDFPTAVRSYWKRLGEESQKSFFESSTKTGSPTRNFDDLWKTVRDAFLSFGRLSTWSYLEYLFIAGLDLEPSSMMLGDMSGSKSHRNGLALVLGRDELDWRKDSEFGGDYSPAVLEWMEREADLLISEARDAELREHEMRGTQISQEVLRAYSRFTLESALCTYKGWHRPNRRYPNVYADMFADRVRQGQQNWPGDKSLEVFWRCRELYLPAHLRTEETPSDPGLARPKQNHYRLTGQVPMLGEDWGVFKHDETWRLK